MRKGVFLSLSFCAIAATSGIGLLRAQDKSPRSSAPPMVPSAEVELFEAIDAKQIEVKLIALGSHRVNVIIENKTAAPLMVQLPSVFAALPAAAPVLGQFGGGNGGGGQFGGGQFGGGGQLGGVGQQGGAGGGQGLGGGFGGGQLGGGGGQIGGGQLGGGGGQFGGGQFGGGGLMRIETDRPRKLQLEMVCLEHGKPDPNPRMKYTIAPLAHLNADPKVAELCKLLAEGKVSQNIAQAAAWNMANGVSWNSLARKNRRESQYTGDEKYFNETELKAAVRLIGHCHAATDEKVVYAANSSSARRQ